ncbi:MAG: hypothetical protein Q9184_001656 [Pyrenodesmia sp. 2 TL-2023]
MASLNGKRKAEAAKLQDLSQKADPILDDTVDAMNDIGRSQSQQFLERAKATKLRATDESRAHVDKFEAFIATQKSGMAKVFDAEVNKIKKRDEYLRGTMASMLLACNIVQSEQIGTPITGSTAHPASTTILKRLKTLLADYDMFNQRVKTGVQPSASTKPSREDEETLTVLLLTQHERATERIRVLMDNEVSGSTRSIEGSMDRPESDKIWASFSEGQMAEKEPTDRKSSKSWNQITYPACRGVRHIAKGLPERSDC